MASVERDVTLHQPNWLLRAAAAFPLLVAVAAAGASALGLLPWWKALLCVLQVAPTGLLLLFLAGRRNPYPRKRAARLAVDAQGVTIDGAKALKGADVVDAFVLPMPVGPPVVRLTKRLGVVALEAQVSSEADGHALIYALGRGVGQSVTRFPAVAPFWAMTGWRGVLATLAFGAPLVIILMAVLARFVPYGAFVGWPLFVLWGLLNNVSASSVDVGADGLLVTWPGRRRFYGYADVEEVEVLDMPLGRGLTSPQGIRLRMRHGATVDIPVCRHPALSGDSGGDRLRVDALVACVRAARQAAAKGKGTNSLEARADLAGPGNVADLVARGGRSVSEWVHAMRRLLGEEGRYRVNAVPQERLWRVVEDPAAEETSRVGAAAALRARLDDAGRARMVRIADAIASPRMRVALQAAASEPEDGLIEAMEAYEAG